LDCDSEEPQAVPSERKEGRISYCHEDTQSEILRFAQNDSEGLIMRAKDSDEGREAFSRSLLKLAEG
jgi:hypothetical protein